MDCRLSGSSIHGVLKAIILEWVAIPFSQGSNLHLLHCRWILYHWATREALSAKDLGSIPGLGTKIPQAMQWGQKKKTKKTIEREGERERRGSGKVLWAVGIACVKDLNPDRGSHIGNSLESRTMSLFMAVSRWSHMPCHLHLLLIYTFIHQLFADTSSESIHPWAGRFWGHSSDWDTQVPGPHGT